MKKLMLLLFLLIPVLSFSQGNNKDKFVAKDTIGSFLNGNRYKIKAYKKNRQSYIVNQFDYLWFREDGVLEMTILGDADRADWKWDTAYKVIVVKYHDGSKKEWQISFNTDDKETLITNDEQEFRVLEDTELSQMVPGEGESAPYCGNWHVVEHKSGKTTVDYQYMDFIRINGNGIYEESKGGKYLKGTWVLENGGKTLRITIFKKDTVWEFEELKKGKLIMTKKPNDRIILKPE